MLMFTEIYLSVLMLLIRHELNLTCNIDNMVKVIMVYNQISNSYGELKNLLLVLFSQTEVVCLISFDVKRIKLLSSISFEYNFYHGF